MSRLPTAQDLARAASQVLAAANTHFPPKRPVEATLASESLLAALKSTPLPPKLSSLYPLAPMRGAVSYIYHTDVGPGAMLLPDSESLAGAWWRRSPAPEEQRIMRVDL